MKKYVLCAALMALLTLQGLSQVSTLQPQQILPNRGDTLLCWDTLQSKYMFQQIILQHYSDSLISKLRSALIDCQDLDTLNGREIIKMNDQIQKLQRQRSNLQKVVDNQADIIVKSEKDLVKQKRKTVGALIGGAIAVILAIIT